MLSPYYWLSCSLLVVSLVVWTVSTARGDQGCLFAVMEAAVLLQLLVAVNAALSLPPLPDRHCSPEACSHPLKLAPIP